jgi:pimeloyl-ACP methyl ester carboxylesterase
MVLVYGQAEIHYTAEGKRGQRTVVLLHGLVGSSEIWDGFAQELATSARVIRVDLPGHGKSGMVSQTHGMELMADLVKAVLDREGVAECVMVGHSMGGYVTLAFAEKHPDMLRGFALFHSSAYADSDERRARRAKTIEDIGRDHRAYVEDFIPGLFAPAHRGRLRDEMERLVRSAEAMGPDAIVAAQRGIMERPDRREVLAQASCPVLLVAGKLDGRVSFDTMLELAAIPKDATALLLHDVAHMGFLEARDKTLHALRCHVERAFGTGG